MQYQVNPMPQTQEKHQKPRFWLFGSFKETFLWLFNDPAWVVQWPTHANHLVLSRYAISSQSNAPNLRKAPKTSFLAVWIIQKGIFMNFEWSRKGDTTTNSCALFSSIKICNIKSIRCPKREKLAETHMDHSKGLKRVDASHGKLFKKRTVFFPDMRFSRWYS